MYSYFAQSELISIALLSHIWLWLPLQSFFFLRMLKLLESFLILTKELVNKRYNQNVQHTWVYKSPPEDIYDEPIQKSYVL